MKKLLLLLFVCIISANLMAQKNKTGKAPAPSSLTSTNDLGTPPPPPPPPAPPVPPPAPPEQVEQVTFTPPVLINDNGYDLSVQNNNGKAVIYATKAGVTEKIPMAKWNANKSFYEKKYGELPPPPPPPPAPKGPPPPPPAPPAPPKY